MKVEAILRIKGRTVETTPPGTTVASAIGALTSLGIGALVVSSDGHRVEGVISEREIVRGLSRYGSRLLEMPVERLMAQRVPVCAPQDTVKDVMRQMTLTRHRHIPVVDDERLVGIVSIGDMVKNRLEELEHEVILLREAYIARR